MVLMNPYQTPTRKNTLKQIQFVWSKANKQFCERIPRERLFMIAVAAAVLWVALDFLVMAPMREQNATVKAQIASQQHRINDYQTKIGQLADKTTQNPNIATQREIDRINASLSTLEGKLGAVLRSLITGDLLLSALEDVLKRTDGLTLLGLNTLPMEMVYDPSNGLSRSGIGLHKHPLQLRIQGDYFVIIGYLKKIESLPYQFYWERLDYRKSEQGKWVATLEVYTLSMDKASLGI